MTANGNIDITQGILTFTRMMVSGTGSVNAKNGGILRFENYSSGSWTKAVVSTTGRSTSSEETIRPRHGGDRDQHRHLRSRRGRTLAILQGITERAMWPLAAAPAPADWQPDHADSLPNQQHQSQHR